MPSYKFNKGERLKSRKKISEIFDSGKSIKSFPVLCYYIYSDIAYSPYPAQAGFTVSKRNFKRAVDRNMIKRKMREAYRLNKNEFLGSTIAEGNAQLMLMLVYTGREIPEYKDIEKGINKILKRIRKEQ